MSNTSQTLETILAQIDEIEKQIDDPHVTFKDFLRRHLISMRVEFERQLSLANNDHKKLDQSY